MRAEMIAGAAVVGAAVALLPLAVEAAPKVGQRVALTACVFPGVTGNCLMIKSSDGTVYNITSMTPRPRQLDYAIRLRGTATDKMSMCNQGIVVDKIRWTRTRMKCGN